MVELPQYGHRERVGIKKLGVTDPRFKFFAWRCIGKTGDVMLTGCVVSRTLSKGPRKGQPAYEKPHFEVVVTEAERLAERDNYTRETGKCGDCMGSGKRLVRWSTESGSEYGPCPSCGGSGQHVAKGGA